MVEGNDQSGEGCMEHDGEDDGAMDGTLDETESQWPSEEAIRTDSRGESADGYRLGLCLEVRAKGTVVMGSILICGVKIDHSPALSILNRNAVKVCQ